MADKSVSRRSFLRAVTAGVAGVAGATLLDACGAPAGTSTATTPVASGDATAGPMRIKLIKNHPLRRTIVGPWWGLFDVYSYAPSA